MSLWVDEVMDQLENDHDMEVEDAERLVVALGWWIKTKQGEDA